jgi:RNA methyltransferase, TrmH family
MSDIRLITSRDNPLLQRVRKLTRDPVAYRKLGVVWLEGEHLCSALLARGGKAGQAVISESAQARPELAALAGSAAQLAVVPDRLFADLGTLPSPAGIGFLCDLAARPEIDPLVPTVVLDRVQDAGNVGSILRSASALGVSQVLALSGTAGLWSPKVLRAGMGAQFGLRLLEGLSPAELDVLKIPWVATSSHAADALPQVVLPSPCAWFFGHEGQGVSPELMARCALTVRIPQPGGEESLNVAAAAAICLYESMRAAGA